MTVCTYKHAVLADLVMFKCNYCVESVIDVLKVTPDEFDVCSFAFRLVKLFKNSLLSQFLLNHLGSAFYLIALASKKYRSV
ncbi:hypothetical protein TSAR_010172 [Trichomalopsis sarcophagae]|uniref:Uncharacterized protein n=1 Tax=Trichomalopsis sarcophagae TaxID=543379 RepID=A0A232ETJ8_9HYME|nr:hypothetical protein TSAR_010172 [Trichomalopsis sarcophagae]